MGCGESKHAVAVQNTISRNNTFSQSKKSNGDSRRIKASEPMPEKATDEININASLKQQDGENTKEGSGVEKVKEDKFGNGDAAGANVERVSGGGNVKETGNIVNGDCAPGNVKEVRNADGGIQVGKMNVGENVEALENAKGSREKIETEDKIDETNLKRGDQKQIMEKKVDENNAKKKAEEENEKKEIKEKTDEIKGEKKGEASESKKMMIEKIDETNAVNKAEEANANTEMKKEKTVEIIAEKLVEVSEDREIEEDTICDTLAEKEKENKDMKEEKIDETNVENQGEQEILSSNEKITEEVISQTMSGISEQEFPQAEEGVPGDINEVNNVVEEKELVEDIKPEEKNAVNTDTGKEGEDVPTMEAEDSPANNDKQKIPSADEKQAPETSSNDLKA